jgi:hypothetical protein
MAAGCACDWPRPHYPACSPPLRCRPRAAHSPRASDPVARAAPCSKSARRRRPGLRIDSCGRNCGGDAGARHTIHSSICGAVGEAARGVRGGCGSTGRGKRRPGCRARRSLRGSGIPGQREWGIAHPVRGGWSHRHGARHSACQPARAGPRCDFDGDRRTIRRDTQLGVHGISVCMVCLSVHNSRHLLVARDCGQRPYAEQSFAMP